MTRIQPVALRTELMELYHELKKQREEMALTAAGMNIEPVKLRDTTGGFVMAPVLAAEANTLHALVLLNAKEF